MKSIKQVRFLTFILALAMLVGFVPVNKAEASGGLTVGDVPIGSIIIDAGSEWEFRTGDDYTGTGEIKPIEWRVVARDHYRAGETTVITDELIGKHRFDNSKNRGSSDGSNHWGESGTTNATKGLRKFLNGSSYNGDDKNEYDVTFYDSFGADFKSAVMETELENVAYVSSSKSEPYTTKDKVWLPSQTEMGLGETDTYKIGEDFGYFKDNASRIVKMGGSNPRYWTRSPHASHAYFVRDVHSDGSSCYNYAYYSSPGVRPALHLKSDNLVEKIDDNKYKIINGTDETYNPLSPYLIDKIHNLSEARKYGSWADGYYGKQYKDDNYRKFDSTISEGFGLVISSDDQRIETILPNGWVITIDNYGMINWHKEFTSDQPTVIGFDGNKVTKIELGNVDGLGLAPLLYTNDGFIHYIDPSDNQVRMLPIFQDEIKGTFIYHEKSNKSTHFLFIRNDGQLVYVDSNRLDKATQINMNDVAEVIPATHERPDYFLMKDGTLKTLTGSVTIPGGLTVKSILSNRYAELSDDKVYSMQNTELKSTDILSFMIQGATNNLLALQNGQIMTVDGAGVTSYLGDVNGKLVKSIVKVDENSTFILMIDNTTKAYGDISVTGDLVSKGIDYTKVKGFLSNNTGKAMLMTVVEETFEYNGAKYGGIYNSSGVKLDWRNFYALQNSVMEEIEDEFDFTFDPQAQADALVTEIENRINNMTDISEAEEIQGLINKLPHSHQEDKNRLQQLLLDKIAELSGPSALDIATEAVELAEGTIKQEDVDSARLLVNALDESSEKTALIDRLDAVQALIDAKAELEEKVAEIEKDIEDATTEEELDKIQKEIDKLPDGPEKDKAQGELDDKRDEIKGEGEEEDPEIKVISTANIVVVNDKKVSGIIKGVQIEGVYKGITFTVNGEDTSYSGTPSGISGDWTKVDSLNKGTIWVRSIPAFNTIQKTITMY